MQRCASTPCAVGASSSAVSRESPVWTVTLGASVASSASSSAPRPLEEVHERLRRALRVVLRSHGLALGRGPARNQVNGGGDRQNDVGQILHGRSLLNTTVPVLLAAFRAWAQARGARHPIVRQRSVRAPAMSAAAPDQQLTEQVLTAICTQLELVVGHSVASSDFCAERASARAAGREQVHISFRLGFEHDGAERFGSLLVPLPDAIALASFLLMMPPEGVEGQRESTELDDTLKDALLELGNFVSGAVGGVLREASGHEAHCTAVRTRGCQGVRADVRPAFPYEEGQPLLVGRCQAQVAEFPAFEMILMVPLVAASTDDEAA